MNPEDLFTEITEGKSSNDAANLTNVNVEEEMKKLRPEIEEWYYQYNLWKYDVTREKREDEMNYEDGEGEEDEDDNETVRRVDEKEKAGNIHLFIFPILRLSAANSRLQFLVNNSLPSRTPTANPLLAFLPTTCGHLWPMLLHPVGVLLCSRNLVALFMVQKLPHPPSYAQAIFLSRKDLTMGNPPPPHLW